MMREMATRLASYLGVFLLVVASAELTSRVEDRLRVGTDLLAVPDHDRDLILHDELGIRGRPNGRFKRWHLNSFGFRSPPIGEQPSKGCTRIVVLGASETFGLYESPEKEYPAQLSSLLNSGGCYEVVNAAVVGLTVRGIITLWQNWVARFSPAIVVVYPTPAFYLANSAPGYPGPAAQSTDAPWWTLRLLERAKDVFDFPDFIQRRRISRALAAATDHPPGWAFDTVPVDRLRQFEEDLDRLTELIRQSGARPVLVTHATAFSRPPGAEDEDDLMALRLRVPKATVPVLLEFETLTAEATARVAARRNAALVDAASVMNGHRGWFAEDSVHFNDAGAGTLARLIANALQ